eukprot:c19915_g1_i4.p3 GENE.c19915_g1_i4~~c19915_g1_i4.p3  ORF type:complete len:106 (-),score=3.64 c19915_g1_i4:182-499(-)
MDCFRLVEPNKNGATSCHEKTPPPQHCSKKYIHRPCANRVETQARLVRASKKINLSNSERKRTMDSPVLGLNTSLTLAGFAPGGPPFAGGGGGTAEGGGPGGGGG